MLAILAWASLAVAFGCSVFISFDELRHPQKMWIMNIVWPVTALYFSVFGLWAYLRVGRSMSLESQSRMNQQEHEKKMEAARKNPNWSQVAVAVSHCGSGCAIADVITEFTIFGLALTLFGSELWASYIYDFIAAWSLGLSFNTSRLSRCETCHQFRGYGPRSRQTHFQSQPSNWECTGGWLWFSSFCSRIRTCTRISRSIGS